MINLEKISKLIDEKKPMCICGEALCGSGIEHYGPHEGGYEVEGFDEKQWVYVHCSHCNYDMALWKIMGEMEREEN